MKSHFNIFIVLLISFLLFQKCSEDTPTEPTEKLPEALASATIGNNGGTIKTDNLEITIPSGAFQNNEELKIFKSTEENSFGENLSSDLFTLNGLPAEISKPIDIKIKYKGTLTDSSFIAIGSKGFVKSVNEDITSYQILSANDSSGYLLTTLPSTSENSLGKVSSVNGFKLDVNIGALKGYTSLVSVQKHFKIYFPAIVLTQTYDLAKYLEVAYTKVKAMGFSYSRRTKWPVEVTVKRLKSEVFGYSYNSVWGDNYGYLEFNFDKMNDKENLKVTAGHEFFHLVQSLYDPRNRYSKAKFFTPHLWLDEACAVWSEEFYSSETNYVSPIFAINAYEILKGAKTGSIQKEAADYGYGMASFIKYITNKYGNKKLVDVYNNIYSGDNTFTALNNALPKSIESIWSLFLSDLFTFSLYDGGQFKKGSILGHARNSAQKFQITNNSDILKVYKGSLPDLSATIFSIENKFQGLSDSVVVTFTCNGGTFQLYQINSSQSKYITNAKDSFSIENFKKINDAGSKIVAVLYNNNFDPPFTNTKDYEMKIEVKPPQNKIIDVSLELSITGTYKKKDSTTIRGFNYFGHGIGSGNRVNSTIQTNGNTVVFTRVYSHLHYTNIVDTTEIVFDNIANPLKVISISWKRIEHNWSSGTETLSATAKNIPFFDTDDNGAKEFSHEGDISPYLTSFSYLELDLHNNFVRELTSYESQGSISLMIYYEQ